MDEQLQAIIDFLQSRDEVIIAWLYGSRARNDYDVDSDYDIAVAFEPHKLPDILDNRLRPELLALDLQKSLGLSESSVSIIDINNVAVALAFNAITSDCVLVNKDVLKQMTNETIIMSKYEDEKLSLGYLANAE
jgi:predicted nucleotidyltransferase